MTRQFIEMRRENRPNIIKRWSISFFFLNSRRGVSRTWIVSAAISKTKNVHTTFPHSADKKETFCAGVWMSFTSLSCSVMTSNSPNRHEVKWNRSSTLCVHTWNVRISVLINLQRWFEGREREPFTWDAPKKNCTQRINISLHSLFSLSLSRRLHSIHWNGRERDIRKW